MKLLKLAACIATVSLLAACGGGSSSSSSSNDSGTPDKGTPDTGNPDTGNPDTGNPDTGNPDTDKTVILDLDNVRKVLETNADIAYAAYSDSVSTAEDLKVALGALKDTPTAGTLKAAKQAWLVSREPYGQTEVYRFRNSPIDSDDYATEGGPEGDLNAWPLGEALIDYVKVNTSDFGDDQVGVTANEVGINGGGALTATQAEADNANNIIGNALVTIDADLLANTASAADEHDVIAGYHAIEFLLWGQDLNTTNQNATIGTDRDNAVNTGDMGGQRPLADFISAVAGDAAERRHAYLEAAVDKLIVDLKGVQTGWEKDVADNYRSKFTTIATQADAKQKITEILTGMGTLSEGELAGERMQIAFAKNSQEDEHSCFSDNTHRDIWLNAEGVSNSFTGNYAGYDSTLDGFDNAIDRAVNGYGIDDLLNDAKLTAFATATQTALDLTEVNYTKIDTSARAGAPFDVLIMPVNSAKADNPVSATIISLNAQSTAIQSVATGLGLGDVVDEDASGCDTTTPGSDAGC